MTVCEIFFKLKFSKFMQNIRTLIVFGKFLYIVMAASFWCIDHVPDLGHSEKFQLNSRRLERWAMKSFTLKQTLSCTIVIILIKICHASLPVFQQKLDSENVCKEKSLHIEKKETQVNPLIHTSTPWGLIF